MKGIALVLGLALLLVPAAFAQQGGGGLGGVATLLPAVAGCPAGAVCGGGLEGCIDLLVNSWCSKLMCCCGCFGLWPGLILQVIGGVWSTCVNGLEFLLGAACNLIGVFGLCCGTICGYGLSCISGITGCCASLVGSWIAAFCSGGICCGLSAICDALCSFCNSCCVACPWNPFECCFACCCVGECCSWIVDFVMSCANTIIATGVGIIADFFGTCCTGWILQCFGCFGGFFSTLCDVCSGICCCGGACTALWQLLQEICGCGTLLTGCGCSGLGAVQELYGCVE